MATKEKNTTDYAAFNKMRREGGGSPGECTSRFVPYRERKNQGVWSLEQFKHICRGKFRTTWLGVDLMKGPNDVITYQQLLWELKPATIIETGSYTGASAMWMEDILKCYGHKTHIYSIDIDDRSLSPLAKARKNITFIKGDCNYIEKSFPSELLQSLPHPWLFTEDAHTNIVNVLKYFDQFSQPGDYFVVEDGCPFASTLSASSYDEVTSVSWGSNKLDLMAEFMKTHSNRFLVDTYYCDFFGYNGSWNWNGFWKRF